jgi:hypothetical protein
VVAVTGISISGTDAADYTFNATASTTANVTPFALTVTAAGVGKVYDGTTTAAVTLTDDRIAGDHLTASYTSATFDTKDVGTNKVVTVTGISISGADAADYTFNATASTTANVTAANTPSISSLLSGPPTTSTAPTVGPSANPTVRAPNQPLVRLAGTPNAGRHGPHQVVRELPPQFVSTGADPLAAAAQAPGVAMLDLIFDPARPPLFGGSDDIETVGTGSADAPGTSPEMTTDLPDASGKTVPHQHGDPIPPPRERPPSAPAPRQLDGPAQRPRDNSRTDLPSRTTPDGASPVPLAASQSGDDVSGDSPIGPPSKDRSWGGTLAHWSAWLLAGVLTARRIRQSGAGPRKSGSDTADESEFGGAGQ